MVSLPRGTLLAIAPAPSPIDDEEGLHRMTTQGGPVHRAAG